MLAKFIGIPYKFRTMNCWHFVVMVRKEFNIKTRMFKTRTMQDAFDVITAQMSIIDNGLSLVDEPQDFDIVIVEKIHKKRRAFHCGVYHDGGVLHCDNQFKSSRYEPLEEFKKGYEGVTFWR
jgi:hypothetical protein